MKEVVIDNESQTFLFPHKISAGPSNMYISSNIPQIRIEIQGKPNVITFDTRNVKSTLAGLFIQQYPELVSGLENALRFAVDSAASSHEKCTPCRSSRSGYLTSQSLSGRQTLTYRAAGLAR